MSSGESDYLRKIAPVCTVCEQPRALAAPAHCATPQQHAKVPPVLPCTCYNGEPVTSWDPECPSHRTNPLPAEPAKPEHPNDRLGAWMSAALDDPNVCAEMKADIHAWFESLTPPADPFPGDRKQYPVFTGLLKYFPDACAAVARCSLIASKQHGLDTVRWDRSKSVGEGDELLRHLMQGGTLDSDGIPHDVKAAWRSLELVQRRIEMERRG